VLIQQQVLRLDVAVNKLAMVGILQGTRRLVDVCYDAGEGDVGAFVMALAQVTMRGVAHHEERDALSEAEVLHLDDVRVVKMSDELGLTQEVLLFLRVKKVDLEDFDRVRGVQVDMLAQVDIGEATGIKEAEQAIVAKLLASVIVQWWLLFRFSIYAPSHRRPRRR